MTVSNSEGPELNYSTLGQKIDVRPAGQNSRDRLEHLYDHPSQQSAQQLTIGSGGKRLVSHI